MILKLCEADQATQQQADQVIDAFAAKGFRTLGVGRTDANGHWQFLGILPLYDPSRDDSAATIAEARRYGIFPANWGSGPTSSQPTPCSPGPPPAICRRRRRSGSSNPTASPRCSRNTNTASSKP